LIDFISTPISSVVGYRVNSLSFHLSNTDPALTQDLGCKSFANQTACSRISSYLGSQYSFLRSSKTEAWETPSQKDPVGATSESHSSYSQLWREGNVEQFLLSMLRVARFRRGWMRTPAYIGVPGEPDA